MLDNCEVVLYKVATITMAGISHNGFRPNNNQSKQGVTA